MGWIEALGRRTILFIAETGRVAMTLFKSIRIAFYPPIGFRNLIKQM